MAVHPRNCCLRFPSDVSRTSNIAVSAYLRTVQGQDDMGNDLLMARVDLTPMLDTHVRFYPLMTVWVVLMLSYVSASA